MLFVGTHEWWPPPPRVVAGRWHLDLDDVSPEVAHHHRRVRAGEGTTEVQVGGSAAEPLPVSVSDSFGGTYSQQSNDAGTAVFTGSVGTPPASSSAPATPAGV